MTSGDRLSAMMKALGIIKSLRLDAVGASQVGAGAIGQSVDNLRTFAVILKRDLVLHRIVENLAVGADQRCPGRILQVAELLDIASAEVIDAVGEMIENATTTVSIICINIEVRILFLMIYFS